MTPQASRVLFFFLVIRDITMVEATSNRKLIGDWRGLKLLLAMNSLKRLGSLPRWLNSDLII